MIQWIRITGKLTVMASFVATVCFYSKAGHYNLLKSTAIIIRYFVIFFNGQDVVFCHEKIHTTQKEQTFNFIHLSVASVSTIEPLFMLLLSFLLLTNADANRRNERQLNHIKPMIKTSMIQI